MCFISVFVCTYLNDFKTCKWVNSSSWPIDVTLAGPTNPGENEPGNNDNEGVLHIPQGSWTRTSPSDVFSLYLGHTWGEGLLPTRQNQGNNYFLHVSKPLKVFQIFGDKKWFNFFTISFVCRFIFVFWEILGVGGIFRYYTFWSVFQ